MSVSPGLPGLERRRAGPGRAAAALLLAALSAGVIWRAGTAGSVFLLLGAGLGVALFHASFGFAGAFRALIREGRSLGVRAHVVLLGLLLLVFLPALEAGQLLGQPVRGFVFPVGLPLLAGAFLFGIGMQIGGGCASGTLYAAAGGQAPRPWLTLAAFVAGATLAAWQVELWQGWPGLPPVSLLAWLGAGPLLAASLAVLALAWAWAVRRERRRHGAVQPLSWRGHGRFWHALWAGGWPPLWGALALALLSIATLFLAGRPWAITAALPLWGSRLVEVAGLDDPAFWPFWEDPTRSEAILRPLLADTTTLMNLGLMAGAALAALLAGRSAAWRWPRPGEALASLLGGLLLGVGAVLASGCNISAYLGGIASGSLHGWLWIPLALAGNHVGARLRPAFGLS